MTLLMCCARNSRNNGVLLKDIRRIIIDTYSRRSLRIGETSARRSRRTPKFSFTNGKREIYLADFARGENKNLMIRAGVSAERFSSNTKTFTKNFAFERHAFDENEISELHDEMEIEFAGGVLKVLHTPGHTPGSCSFLREANRTLIAGDCVLKRITPNP